MLITCLEQRLTLQKLQIPPRFNIYLIINNVEQLSSLKNYLEIFFVTDIGIFGNMAVIYPTERSPEYGTFI
jgi:hypothetical protein